MTGKELKEFRVKHGLSQSELADIVGVKTNTVSKWESGIRNIGQSAIKLLQAYVPELDRPKPKESDLESILGESVYKKVKPVLDELKNDNLKLKEILFDQNLKLEEMRQLVEETLQAVKK